MEIVGCHENGAPCGRNAALLDRPSYYRHRRSQLAAHNGAVAPPIEQIYDIEYRSYSLNLSRQNLAIHNSKSSQKFQLKLGK
jgi:hypothetical protein